MRAEILTIGDELCRGDIIDTNSSWLARELWLLDVSVIWKTSCRDEEEDMRQALDTASGRADLVVVSGGLGPTVDDKTVDVVAQLLGATPEIHEPSRARMEERFARVGMPISDSTARQVRFPGGARVIDNPVGLAPGFEVQLNGASIFFMPGVPREMKGIFQNGVVPRIVAMGQERGQAVQRVAKRTLRVFGVGESQVASTMEGLLDGVSNATLHYRVPFPEVLLQIVVRDGDRDAAARVLGELETEARSRLAHLAYGVDDESLAEVLGRALARRGATLATAESCTGGLIGALMTEVPGSSAYFTGGAITYSNEEKTRQLGVPEDIFATHGAVSQPCVEAMARGARERFGVTYAVAVSGVAGPGGGTADKPVGTIWLAVAGPGGVKSWHRQWARDRESVRRLAAYWAMAKVLHTLDEEATDRGA